MKPYKRVDRIEVFLWGQRVGAVALDPKLNYYVFAYDTKFVDNGVELAPLNMPLLKNKMYIFPELSEQTFQRLPAMLSDSLPDSFGNALINKYMSEKGIDVSVITPLDRLAYMGKRAMGALEFKPNKGPKTETPTSIELGKLVEEARLAISGDINSDDHSKAVLRNIIEVGTSAGGARAKAVIAINPTTREIRSGQVDAPPGYEHWLLKFDGLYDGLSAAMNLGDSQNFGRIEYAYSLMAKDAGIDMMECDLLKENGRAHFITKRFDRTTKNEKHHIQTLCSINHMDYKLIGVHSYEQFFLTIQQMDLGLNELSEAFRRMIFNIAAKNCDDHPKNFSFILKQGESWSLAPAYDITFAYKPESQWVSKHLLSVNGKFDNFTKKDFEKIADRFSIGNWREIVKQVEDSVKRWNHFASLSGLGPADAKRIKSFLLPF